MDEETKATLVRLQKEKALRFLSQADDMMRQCYWDLAANRFYYACFHAAQAALVHFGLSAHTHAGTIAVFGRNFVKTEKIDKSLGAFFSRMEQLRMKADYNCDYDVTQTDVESMIQPARNFLAAIERLLAK